MEQSKKDIIFILTRRRKNHDLDMDSPRSDPDYLDPPHYVKRTNQNTPFHGVVYYHTGIRI